MEQIFSGLYIETEKLAAFAANGARLAEPEAEGGASSAAAALKKSFRAVRRCREAVRRRYAGLDPAPAACEWLLDNWYLAQRETQAALFDLRRAERQRLVGGELLMSRLCRSLLSAGQGRIDEERCLLFLRGFQTVTPLRRRELLLFPAAMRAAILESMAAVCDSLAYAADTAPQARAFEALFSSLRFLGGADAELLLRGADLCDEALAGDPTGDYPRMDRESRRSYLERLEALARAEGCEEQLLARRLVRQAQGEGKHVGFLLFDEPSGTGAGLYIASVSLCTLFLSLLTAFAAGSVWSFPLLLLPVSELVKGLVDLALLCAVPPHRLPRMDLEQGVPPEGKTLCVISALLTDAECAERLCRRMEEFSLAHRRAGDKLLYGILADLPAADEQETEADAPLLRAAREAVAALNRRRGGGFYLFTRPRSYDGERWSGEERKRGALLELAALLVDEPSSLSVTGERDALAGTRFLLTLDSDTRMQPGAALSLIGAMLHPMNRAVVDPDRRVVTRGYGLIQPRLCTELRSACATDFALVFAGPGGGDPYGSLCGELYMDAFDCGGFAGKGILDVRALLTCTRDRFPARSVLSHDALEGAFLRGGTLSDAAFSDAFPSRPLSYFRRLHRWVRGDWQNAPWLFRRGRGLRPIDRWRLFDSLRRSLFAPATLLAILAGFFLPVYGLRLSAWTALLALLSELTASLLEGARRSRTAPRLRRFARSLTGVGGAIVRCFLRLWLLPWEAWVCLSAAVTALWRLLVTRKRLLEWVTAAQCDGSGGLLAHARAMPFPAALGLFCLLFSPAVIGRSAGLLWLLSPAAAAALALPAFRAETLSRADRDWLRERAAETWRYFASFCTEEEHFLPPDNVQTQPPKGPAHRTSPTNLGLAAAAAVAAADMALISREEALAFLGRLIGGMERLPRCRGHFYNWYDTRRLQSLHPPFLSAVDSGNCFAALRVAEAFAREQGEDGLAARIESLLAPMDFSLFYDGARELLAICYDTAKGQRAGGYYDLLASEAMLTSYLAIAKGDAPTRHWRRLGRGQLQQDGFRGLASWSGTMFEYLMPFLFLPLERGSLLYESSRFCVYAQRRCVPAGVPWGISESAYFALDPAGNYRYKAHGCPALALRRGQERDLVLAPYASFLALAVAPRAAVQNLRRLERRGLCGRWGFREALDLTPGRCRGEDGELVDCTMAHHAGMSLLAAANALCEGSIRRRFMAQPDLSAHELLLQERPGDGAVLRRREDETRGREVLPAAGRWQRRASGDEAGMCLLSNGAYHLLLDERGRGSSVSDESFLPLDGSLILTLDGEPLLPGPVENLLFQEDEAAFFLRRGAGSLSLRAFVAADERGECRALRLNPDEDGEARIALRFRPVLAGRADWESHPAFWRLGLWAEEREGALLLRRAARQSCPETWLCLRATRPLSLRADEGGRLGWLSRPLVEAEAVLPLCAEETAELRFALCLGAGAEAAYEGAGRILHAEETERGRMIGGAATLLGMSAAEIGQAMELLPALTRPALHEAAPKAALWPYGVSGELPLLCCRSDARETEALLRRFLLLRSAGIEAELVYLSDEEGEYRQPFRRRLLRALARHGLEPLLGARGGVHLLPLEAADAAESRSVFVCGRAEEALPAPPEAPVGAPRQSGCVPRHGWTQREFRFEAGDALPGRPWQQILTNGRFGWIFDERGGGFLWLDNAREMPLTEPPALPGEPGGEALWVDDGGRSASLFAANDGRPCLVGYAPGLAVWTKTLGSRTIKTTAFVPDGADARLLLIEGAEGLTLHWVQRLFHPASVRCAVSDGLFRAEDPDAWLPETAYLAACDRPARIETGFSPAALHLSVPAGPLTVLACGCCPEERLRELCRPPAALQALSRTAARWAALCCRDVSCADEAAAHYLGGWAAYQAIACRLFGRCSLYQRGGAYGFRDQLQDAANVLKLEPAFLRERLIDACRHQYVEGDVMHWWHPHPAGDRGLRSRCSDDLLWLPWALCEWVEQTGDAALCLQTEPFITSPPLREDERDRYEIAERSANRATLLDHARAALDRCLARGFGAHALPFMGGGDWNDALDRAGGESVWLGFFLAHVAARFASLLDALELPGAARFRETAARVGAAADAAFAGGHYLRGYRPDGRALGGEDRVDATVQSWAVLSGFGSPDKTAQALDAALSRLVDPEKRLVRLFDPPWSPDEPSPGYISSYGEGFRENGGQYTHGAIWLAMALHRAGRTAEAKETLRLLLPEGRDLARYGAEPYVLPADVCAAPGREGEAGWTWYTGSAGWFLRAAREIGL